jgi:hypothetical protein
MARLQRLFKRSASPTNIRSDHEVILFAIDTGRLKVVNFDHTEHTIAWLEEIGGGGPGGGGIEFDTYPQFGDWLYAESTDASGSPNGYGIELNSANDVVLESAEQIALYGDTGKLSFNGGGSGSPGLWLLTSAGKILLQNTVGGAGDGGVVVQAYEFIVDTTPEASGNNIHLKSYAITEEALAVSGSGGTITLTADRDVTIQSTNTNMALYASSGTMTIQASNLVFNGLSQVVAVTTLAEVITLLQSYGLAA